MKKTPMVDESGSMSPQPGGFERALAAGRFASLKLKWERGQNNVHWTATVAKHIIAVVVQDPKTIGTHAWLFDGPGVVATIGFGTAEEAMVACEHAYRESFAKVLNRLEGKS